jgi:hypothetical protein
MLYIIHGSERPREKALRILMTKAATATVTFIEGTLDCEPEVVKLYYLSGPSAVEWVLDSLPPGTDRVSITFEGQEQVFRDIAVTTGSSLPLKICMSGYSGGPRTAKYTIRCYDAKGVVIAENDPGIDINSDPPPL